VSPGPGMPIGRKGSAYWTLGFFSLAGTLLLTSAFGVGTAHAAAPPAPADLGTQIEARVATQVDAAIAESATMLSQAQHAVAAQAPDAGPLAENRGSSVSVAPTPAPSAPPSDLSVGTVELASAPSTPALALRGVVTSPATAAAETTRAPLALRVLQHTVGPPVGRTAVTRSAVRPWPPLQAIAVVGTTVERATVRATEQLRTAEGSVPARTHARPNPAPAPPRPFFPSAPGLPSSSTSPSGAQSAGQGAPLMFLLVTLGGLAVFGIPLLRRVFWSDRRMQGLVADLPWRPG
jgi:hypothetical protein